MCDLRLETPSTFLISGPSQSGKTVFVSRMINDGPYLFKDPRCFQNVLFYYNHWQPLYSELKDKKDVRFFDSLPSLHEVKDLTEPYSQKGGSVVVIDDYMQRVNQDISTMFTVLSHHANITFFLITQNLFPKNKFYRDISLNSTYIVIFKNPRDLSQISVFARQFGSRKYKEILNAYREATEKPFSYIFFDNHQKTEDRFRIKSDIFGDIHPLKIWLTCQSI